MEKSLDFHTQQKCWFLHEIDAPWSFEIWICILVFPGQSVPSFGTQHFFEIADDKIWFAWQDLKDQKPE